MILSKTIKLGTFVFALLLMVGGSANCFICEQSLIADGQRKFAHSLYAESATDFEKALAKSPSNKTALAMAGWSYFKQGRYDLSQAKFGALYQMDNKSEDALEGLGWTYFKTGQYYNALQTFEALASKNKNHISAIEGGAYTKFKLGDLAGAKKVLGRALLFNPLSADSHSILGYIALAELNYRDAARHFKHALQLSKEKNPALEAALDQIPEKHRKKNWLQEIFDDFTD